MRVYYIGTTGTDSGVVSQIHAKVYDGDYRFIHNHNVQQRNPLEVVGLEMIRSGRYFPKAWYDAGGLIVCDSIKQKLERLGQPHFIPIRFTKLVDVAMPPIGTSGLIDLDRFPDVAAYHKDLEPYWQVYDYDPWANEPADLRKVSVVSDQVTIDKETDPWQCHFSESLLTKQPIIGFIEMGIREDAFQFIAPELNLWLVSIGVYDTAWGK